LQQQDINGTITFSPIKVIDLNATGAIELFPNPVADVLNIKSNHIFNNAHLKIWNVNGLLMKEVLLNGGGTISLPAKTLLTGVYSAEIIEGRRKK